MFKVSIWLLCKVSKVMPILQLFSSSTRARSSGFRNTLLSSSPTKNILGRGRLPLVEAFNSSSSLPRENSLGGLCSRVKISISSSFTTTTTVCVGDSDGAVLGEVDVLGAEEVVGD